MSFGISGLGDGMALIELIYGSIKYAEEYQNRNVTHARMSKRIQDYLQFLKELSDEYPHAKPDADDQLIADDIRSFQDTFQEFHKWLEEAETYLHPPLQQNLLQRGKNTARRHYFAYKAKKKMEDFDKSLDWDLFNAQIAKSERRKNNEYRATTLAHQKKATDNMEDLRAKLATTEAQNRNLQSLAEEGLIRQDENARAMLEEMNTLKCAVTALASTSGALPVKSSFERVLQMGLKHTLGLSAIIAPLCARLERLQHSLSVKVIHPAIGSVEIPTHQLLEGVSRVINDSSSSQSDRRDPIEGITDTPIHDGTSGTNGRHRTLDVTPIYIHHAHCSCGQCPERRWEFGTDDETPAVPYHAPALWCQGSSTSFSQRGYLINKHWDTAEAIRQGIDLEAATRIGYSFNAGAYLKSVRVEYHQSLEDNYYIDLQDDYRLRSPKLRLHGMCNVTKPKSLSLVHVVKDSALFDPAFSKRLRSALLRGNCSTPPVSERSLPWVGAAILGSWDVLLHMMVADYGSLNFYQNVQAALGATDSWTSNELYSGDCVEQIIDFALRDAPSNPKVYQEMIDEALFEATNHQQKDFIQILLFVGANPFAKMTRRCNQTAFKRAVEFAANSGVKELVEDFLITAWDQHLINIATCQHLMALLDLSKKSREERNNLDRACLDITASVLKQVGLEKPYWLTNLLARKSFGGHGHYQFWSRYVKKHGLLEPGNPKINIAAIIALTKKVSRRRSGCLLTRSEVQFSWNDNAGWFAGDLKHMEPDSYSIASLSNERATTWRSQNSLTHEAHSISQDS